MNDVVLWIVAGLFTVFVIPAVVVALSEKLRRRRNRALGRRRKTKMRL